MKLQLPKNSKLSLSALLLSIALYLGGTHPSWAETPNACGLLTTSEATLLSKFPAPLAEFISKNKNRKFLVMKASDQRNLFEALDYSLKTGKHMEVALEKINVDIQIEKTADGVLTLSFPKINRDGMNIGETVSELAKNKKKIARDFSFAQVLTATFSWFAENVEKAGAKELRIVGENLQNKELIERLYQFGFTQSRQSSECTILTIVSSIIGAAGGAIVWLGVGYFDHVNGDEKIDSERAKSLIKDASLGATAGGGASLLWLCPSRADGRGFDYILRVKLKE